MVACADGSQSTAIFNLPAVIIIALVTALLVIGIKESANVNSFIVIVKVAVVLLFIVGAAHAVNPANWHPFIPPQTVKDGAPVAGAFGWSGVFTGAAIVFFAYIGFDAVSTAAQEAKNPQKDMPIGIIGSLLICTVLYILVSGIATGIMSYKDLNVPDPIAVVADHAGLGWMSTLIKLGAIAGLSSVILVMLLGQSRVFWTMSRTVCCRSSSTRSTRSSRRRTSPRSSPASASRSSRRSCRFATRRAWSPSARCWHSSSSPSASWCSASASRICPVPSRRPSSGSSRRRARSRRPI